MDKNIVLKVEHLSKLYKLGQFGTGTFSHDLNRWFYRLRKKEDPYLKIGQENNRTLKGGDYVWAIEDVNFELVKGEVLGIVGRNGAGKSTLLKLLSQVTSPTRGRIGINGRIASLLEVGTGFHPELTGKENVFLNGAILGMNKEEIRKKFDEIVEFSGCSKYIDTPIKRYSSGMMVRLAFSVAAHLEAEILIIDEVLAVGDQEFQRKCLGKMKDVAQEGRTVLFVSHNMSSVRALCTKALLLKYGKVDSIGSPDNIVSKYLSEGLRSYKKYEKGPLKDIEVYYRNGKIKLKAHYNVSAPLPIPSLGFVIHDSFGTPLFGNNPKNLGYSMSTAYAQSGSVEVEVSEPSLLDGIFRVSVWFGDGYVDFFEDKECLEFEVVSESNSIFSGNSAVGFIHNKCEYKFLG